MSLTEIKKIESRLASGPTKKDIESWLEIRIQTLTDYLKYDSDDFNQVCKVRGGIVVAEQLLGVLQGENQ